MTIEIKNINLIMSIDYDERSVWLPKYFIFDIQTLLLFKKEYPQFFKIVNIYELIKIIMTAGENIVDITEYCYEKLKLNNILPNIENIDIIIEELIKKLYKHLNYVLVDDDDLYQFHLWIDKTTILLIKKDEVNDELDEDGFKHIG